MLFTCRKRGLNSKKDFFMTKKQSFESAMKRLEEIVAELEQGNLPLEESLKIYQEGVKLTKYCSQILDDTEKKIKMLVKEEGSFKLEETDLE